LLWQGPAEADAAGTRVLLRLYGGRRGKEIVEKSADMRDNELLNFLGVRRELSAGRL